MAALPVNDGRAPGFFAKDIQSALTQRAAWFESLGDAAVLDSENVDSDASEEWDGETAPASDSRRPSAQPEAVEAEADGKAAKRPSKGLSELLAAASEKTRVEYNAFEISKAREHFAKAQFVDSRTLHAEGNGPGNMGQLQRPEPPARRLGRLKAEVATLCDWAEQHTASSGSQEAEKLRREVREVAETMQGTMQEVSAHGASKDDFVLPQRVWLPPPPAGRKEDVSMAKQLLELNRASLEAPGRPSEPSATAPAGVASPGSSMGYSLTAPSGSGWLLAAQAEAIAALQARLQGLTELVGTPEDKGAQTSLAAATSQLSQRLQHLERVFDSPSCERLLASARLLSADIDIAVEEAKRLEAIEAEEEKEEAELAKPISPTSKALAEEVEASVETTDSQVLKLFDQLSTLDATAGRIEELKRELAVQDASRKQLEHFSADLASAEARTMAACELLRSTAAAASTMRESTVACAEQLRRDVKALEAKVSAMAPKGLP